MSNPIQQSFDLNLKVMKLCHYYPPDKQNRFYKILAYLMHISFVVPTPTLGILYLLLESDWDMERVKYNAGFLAQTSCFITKLLPFITNEKRIKKCINYFGSRNFAVVKDIHKDIINDCIAVCRRNTKIFLVCVTGGVSSWATKPLFWKGRHFPVDLWLPFNATENLLTFSFVYLFITFGVLFASCVTGMVDPLIAGLAYHATSQIKILKDNLEHLNEYADQDLETTFSEQTHKNEIIYGKIKQCIEHHDAIMNFVREFEDCFSTSMFSQSAASVFVICFSCLQLSKVESLGYYFVQLVMYFSVILAQIYFYCYYGSLLIEESDTITNAIYASQWFNYDEKSKKALLTLMTRSTKPLIVTAGKLLELSLITFAMILRRSYSLVAVLKNYD